LSETETILTEVGSILDGLGGSGGAAPLQGGSHFLRMTAAGQFRWLPVGVVRVTSLLFFNTGNSIVVSRAPFTSNDVNSLGNGATLADQILWWSNITLSSTDVPVQVTGLNWWAGRDVSDWLYFTWTATGQYLIWTYDHIRPRDN